MSKPAIVIVAAVAHNRVIGVDNKLPWHLPEDLRRFKKLTIGHPVLMGRKTFDSILARNGKPLPDRLNVVLTATRLYPEFPEVVVCNSFEAALDKIKNASQVAVIGGASLYRAALPLANRLELTIIEKTVAGDAFFPEYEAMLGSVFALIACEQREGYRFVTYKRFE